MRKGFTLVEIMIVVAIIGIIIAIAIPGFLRAREVSRARACQENLAKIEGAKEQWGLETNAAYNASCAWSNLIGSTLYLKRTPTCPGGGSYTVGALNADPTCDYTEPDWISDDKFKHLLIGTAASSSSS